MTVVQQPPERDLAFLAHAGVSHLTIRDLVLEARRIGVPPDRQAIASGSVDETTFYRALAHDLRLPFTESLVRADPAAPYPNCLKDGALPGQPLPGAAGQRLFLAPSGNQLESLRASDGDGATRNVVITTPANLRRSAMASLAGRVEHAAIHDLSKRHPGASARDGWSSQQIVGCLAMVGMLSFFGTLDMQSTIRAAGIITGFLFTVMVLIRLVAIFDRCTLTTSEATLLPDLHLPVYTVIVPLHRETRIIRQLVDALTALDYPAAKLDIKIVLEHHDDETRKALAAIAPSGRFDIVVAPPSSFRTKPRALNMALALARGEFCVIYDAEDVPAPDQLRRAATVFRRSPKRLACLQARLSIDNTGDSWLTRLFTIEYAVLFDVLIPCLARLGWPVLLGGTSNHFRTDILRHLGAWDAWNVTEDADLGLRLARHGYHVGELPSTTMEEAPVTLKAWMRQRARWLKGWMQTCMVHTRHPLAAMRALGPARFVVGLALSLGTVLTALLGPLLFGWAAVGLVSGSLLTASGIADAFAKSFALVLLATGSLATLVPAGVALRRRGLLNLLPWLALMPVYHLLIAVAAWLAVWEAIAAPQRWNKTEHGLARSSRSGRKRAA